jgi:hypothetical protein
MTAPRTSATSTSQGRTTDVLPSREPARQGRSRRRGNRFLTRLLVAVLLATLAAWGTTTSASATGGGSGGGAGGETTTWHRLDFGGVQHERISCTGEEVVVCHYDKKREPRLNLAWDSTTARFVGQDITAGWECPEWFPEGVCSQVTRVLGGYGVVHLADGETFNVLGNFVVLENGHMWNYFVEGGFVCPYFTTFQQALEANPFPLPYNGVDKPAEDCLVDPDLPDPAAE